MSELLITDDTPIDHDNIGGGMCGTLPRHEPDGQLMCATVDDSDILEWKDIPDAIADQERNKSSLWHIWKDSKIGALNQSSLSYCWAFSSVEALMMERELMGLPFLRLSPSSVAAPLVNYQNTGFYIERALEQMINVGAATEDYVPQTTTNREDFRIGWKESAACNKVTDWIDVGRDARRQITKLIRCRPLVAAHNWWAHAIMHLRVRDLGSKYAVDDINRYPRDFLQSWGPGQGDGGVCTLQGQRSIADNSYAIKQASFAG